MPVKKLVAAAVCTMMIFLVPLTFYIGRRDQKGEQEQETSTIVEFKKQEVIEDTIVVEVLKGEEVVDMTMHDYLIGVLAAEMPALYPEEALKAQAIAARTNTLYKMEIRTAHPESAKHENADICTDYAHCQSYADEAALHEKWGNEYDTYLARVTKAVEETGGVYVAYEGKVISALFHSISGGMTESAEDVWGSEIPYLQSVDSHWDTESKGYRSEVTLTIEELYKTVQAEYPEAERGEKNEDAVGEITRSKAGGIQKIVLMGVELTGKQFRNLLGLRSTNVTFSFEGDSVRLTVLGYGHGVGLSQDGAKGMAEEGRNAEEILLHYYSGCELMKWDKMVLQ